MFERFGPDVERAWLELIDELGVNYVVHNGLEEVDPEEKVVRAGNVEEEYDLLIKVPPSRLPEPLERSEGFRDESDPRWTRVRPRTFQHPDYDDVFLVGEHSMPTAGLPTAGAPVHYAADLASEVILNDIIGGYPVLGYYRTVYCVTYYGVGGLVMGTEVFYDRGSGKWDFRGYTIMKSPLARLLKEAYYRGFVESLR
jgi:sulfide:quinone oxidoreductase